MFYYLYGCFLSLTELQFNKQDINVIDPFIMVLQGDINYKNRINYSIYIVLSYIIVATIIMLYRFGDSMTGIFDL